LERITSGYGGTTRLHNFWHKNLKERDQMEDLQVYSRKKFNIYTIEKPAKICGSGTTGSGFCSLTASKTFVFHKRRKYFTDSMSYVLWHWEFWSHMLIITLKILSIKDFLIQEILHSIDSKWVYTAWGTYIWATQYDYITSSATSFAPCLLLCTAICNC
jgi:hypothetical protein